MPEAPTIIRHPRGRLRGNAVRAALMVVIVAALVFIVLALVSPGLVLATPAVGVSEPFWALDWDAGEYVVIQATARYVGEHVAVYVQNGAALSEFLVNQLGETFDSVTYPVLTQAFGPEPDPGIDGDPLVAVLIYDFNDGSHSVDGAFSYRDIDPQSGYVSNRREMFYLNLEAVLAEPANISALAAHEFTHLIVYYRDVMLDPSSNRAEEPQWVTEGITTYGEHLAGYDGRTNGLLQSFMNDCNFNLTNWQGVRANYGASYSFIYYLAEREGSDFIRALVGQPLDGIAGINAALASVGSASTFESLFDDWVVAGFLDERSPSMWPYLFSTLTVPSRPIALTGAEPLLGSVSVVNYGTAYLDFPATSSEETFQVVVDGVDGASLRAALISWDSAGILAPTVTWFDLANAAVGGVVTVPAGHDRHTLAVWARGAEGSVESFAAAYSGCSDPPAGIQFLDMGGNDPFYEYAALLLERGVINGKQIPRDSGLWFFAGTDNVTRAQFAKMIMLATGLHTEEIENVGNPTFSDVPSVFDQSGYPYDYVEEAATLGIVKGYGNGTFGPYNSITRAQLVLMIIRGAAAAGSPLPLYTGSRQVFADVPISHQYYDEIMTAWAAGILNGSSGGDGRLYFRPYSPASRNHVAKMTAELLDHLDATKDMASMAAGF